MARWNLPTPAELASLRYQEEWLVLVYERNPKARWHDAIELWSEELDERFDKLGLTALEIETAVRAGGQTRSLLDEELAARKAIRARLVAAASWEDWLRIIIPEFREASAERLSEAMAGESPVVRQRLGAVPGRQQIAELQKELGVGTTNELRRANAARLMEEGLRALPAKLAAARQHRPHVLPAAPVDIVAFASVLQQGRLGNWLRDEESTEARAAAPPPAEGAPLSPMTARLLAACAVPPALYELLERCNFAAAVTLGSVTFDRVDDLPERNLLVDPHCVTSGLLVIGSSDSGDPVTIDLETLTIGFVDGGLGGDDDAGHEEVRAASADSGLDIAAFYRAALRNEWLGPRRTQGKP